MNERNPGKEHHQKRVLRFLLRVFAWLLALSLLGDLAAWGVRLLGGISFGVHGAATIGIIGGADGPTAIFVTSSTTPVWQSILKLLLLIASILGMRYRK